MSELVLPRTVRGLLDVQTIARPDAVYALALDIGDGGEQAQSGIQFAAMAQYCAQVVMKNTFMVVKNSQPIIAWKLAPLFLPCARLSKEALLSSGQILNTSKKG